MLARYKRGLITLFQRVHELQSDPIAKRLLALHIQEDLLRRIGRAEALIRRTRAANKEIKIQLARRGNDREAAGRMKARHTAGTERIEQQRELLLILRAVGDAVAFIYGNRWDLKQLVLHPHAGFVTGKRGTRFERNILRQAFAVGATAVLNDVTNTLRQGDVTIFRPDSEGKFVLVEAKSGRGGQHSRRERQAKALQETSTYLLTDAREDDGGTWLREPATAEPAHHFDKLARLVATLPRAGWISEEVEPGLHYVAIDCAWERGNLDEIFGPTLGEVLGSFVICVNDMKQHQLGYFPFPLSFRDPGDLFRFYNGEFVVFVIIHVNHVNSALARHGLSIIPTENVEFPWKIVPTTCGTATNEGDSYVGFHFLGRLGAEFLRLDWLLENIVALHAAFRRQIE